MISSILQLCPGSPGLRRPFPHTSSSTPARKHPPMIRRSPKPSPLEILASMRAINAQLRRTNEQLRLLLAFEPLTVHAHQSPTSLQLSRKNTAPGSMTTMHAFSSPCYWGDSVRYCAGMRVKLGHRKDVILVLQVLHFSQSSSSDDEMVSHPLEPVSLLSFRPLEFSLDLLPKPLGGQGDQRRQVVW